MDFGSLHFEPAADHLDLVAAPVGRAMQAIDAAEIRVAAIDPSVADTAAFCERYAVALEHGANCVVIEARRGDTARYAACLIRSSDRIDVNGTVRRHLDAKKASFAAREAATGATGMEHGGITPLGLPGGWHCSSTTRSPPPSGSSSAAGCAAPSCWSPDAFSHPCLAQK